MIRFLGAMLIVACAAFLIILYGHVQAPPVHEASVGELFLGLAVIVTGISGAMMLVAGEKLFSPPD